jgi:hypothetical protein
MIFRGLMDARAGKIVLPLMTPFYRRPSTSVQWSVLFDGGRCNSMLVCYYGGQDQPGAASGEAKWKQPQNGIR